MTLIVADSYSVTRLLKSLLQLSFPTSHFRLYSLKLLSIFMNTHIIQYLYDKSTPNSKWALQQFCHVMFSWQQSHFWHHNSVTTSSFLSVRQPECCEKWDVCSRLPPHSCSAFVQSFEKAPPSLTPSSLSPRSLCCCCCRNILSQKNEEQMLESCLQKNGRSFFF